MNKLNAMIKNMMLVYPTLYLSRWDALMGIYFNSSYEWNAKTGEIDNLHEDVWPLKSDEVTLDTFLHNTRSPLEIMEFTFRFQNIDAFVEAEAYSSSPSGWRQINSSLAVLCDNTFGISQYAALLAIPDNAEESFKAGALEVAEALFTTLNTKKGVFQYGVIVQKQLDEVLKKHSYTHSPEFLADIARMISELGQQ